MAKKVENLYRSQEEKLIAGVCGGIADYFGIDPIIPRLIAVLLALLDGAGIVLYLIAWIVVPKHPTQKGKNTAAENIAHKTRQQLKKTGHKGKLLLGVVLVVVGALLLLQNAISWLTMKIILPIVLILLGLYFLILKE
ncbi:MAG: PspC domain-containing protein [Candidatus Woesearchaeota archaeon]|nr:MAG: PspC domain-containing protein [Candidatus Woesearchaeota archaeon]